MNIKIRDNIDKYYAIGDGPNPIGIACLTDDGEIVGCLVDNNYRNQEIMTYLIEKIIEDSSDKYDKIYFGTLKTNKTMNRVGEKLGWKREDKDNAYRYIYTS